MFLDNLQDAVKLAGELDSQKHDPILPANLVSVSPDSGALITRTLFGELHSSLSIQAVRGMLRFMKGTKSQPVAPHIYPSSRYLLEDCPPWLFASNLNHWLGELGDKELLFRIFNNGGESTAVQTFSDRYKVADPGVMLEAIREFMDDAGVDYPVRINLDAYNLYGKVVIPEMTEYVDENGNGQTAYSGGIAFGTSGTGGRSHYVKAFIQRGPCDNSTVLRDGWAKKHLITAPEVKFFVASGMREALSLNESMMERLHQAARLNLDNPLDIINSIVKSRGLGEDAAAHLFASVQTQGGPTLLGLSNAVTFHAHSVDDMWQKAELEELGGDILMAQNMNELNQATAYVPDQTEQFV